MGGLGARPLWQREAMPAVSALLLARPRSLAAGLHDGFILGREPCTEHKVTSLGLIGEVTCRVLVLTYVEGERWVSTLAELTRSSRNSAIAILMTAKGMQSSEFPFCLHHRAFSPFSCCPRPISHVHSV